MKAKELKEMNVEGLGKKLSELRFELIKEDSKIAGGTNPKNPGQVRQIKKTIARILTILNQKNQEGKKV